MFVRRASTQLCARSVNTLLTQRARLATDALTTANPMASKVGVHTPQQPQADTAMVSAFTGTPKEMLDTRVIKIFKPPQGVQNATQNTLSWKIQWEDERTERWSNPLMGWTGTRDPLSNTHMTMEFHTSEEAVRFAQRNGWKYQVIEAPSPNLAMASKGPKKYADNFKWKGPKTRPFPELYEPPPPPPKK